MNTKKDETQDKNVRRTMIMIEQSVKDATKAFVFEPNDANTWSAIKNILQNFL